LDFSNRGSLMFGGCRVFPAQTTDGTMQDGLQTARARTPALAPASFAPILHIQYEEPESPAPSVIGPGANDMSATETTTTEVTTPETIAETTAQSASQITMTTPSIRVLSADVEMESRKRRRAPTPCMGYSKIWKFLFPKARKSQRARGGGRS